MELVRIENSRLIYLTEVVRPAGQVYLPDAVAKLVQRYSFAKSPSLNEIVGPNITFSMGKFRDVQINDLQIYPDGLIVSAVADMNLVHEFLSDLLQWAQSELGLMQGPLAQPQMFFESSVVVRSSKDLALALAPRNDVAGILNRIYRGNMVGAGPYHLSGFLLDSDPAEFSGRYKPLRFVIERRLNVPYREKAFYSVAPVTTQDHLKVLTDLERVAME